VGGGPRMNARGARTPAHDLPDRLPAERLSARANEYPGTRPPTEQPRALGAEVVDERLLRASPARNDSLLPALPEHRDEALLEADLRPRECCDLAHAEAGRVHDLEQRAVA